ncbi:MAG: hypothetical protein M3Y87_06335 [Myxococcota bacterium]|nr:hypothetical protein [Myxococcota bacterium]
MRGARGSNNIGVFMAITIVSHEISWKDRVDAFNHRMRAGGSKYGFYVDPEPTWIPKRSDEQRVWREYFLAIEDGKDVRGGYALKPQHWWVRGELVTVTDWQGPFSEGAISNRYGALGLRMLRDMLKKQPLLYSWGHGGEDQAIVQLLEKLQWRLHPTPFLFRVLRPFHFARKNKYLREDPKKRLALDALAFSGLASVGGRAVAAALRIKSRRRFTAKAEIVPSFGAWADEIWDRGKDDYAALAVRDAAAMNTLAPPGERQREWSELLRLRVRDREGRDLGWALLCDRQMEDHHRYGSLRVGTLVDYFAPVASAGEVVHAALEVLRERGAEIVIANQSDPRWIRALEDNAFLRVEGKRLFCAAPPLVEALEPWDDTKERLFLTNMDGHGPMGL